MGPAPPRCPPPVTFRDGGDAAITARRVPDPSSSDSSSSGNAQLLRDESRTFATVGSGVRLAILSALTPREMSVLELTKALGFHRVTIRYHLGQLLREGLVGEVGPAKSGRAGRPAARYRASRHATIPGFPPRHFEVLAQVSMEALVEALGREEAVRRLREKGRSFGQGLIGQAAADLPPTGWTPEEFCRRVLRGAFRNFGVETEVLSRSEDHVTFRCFTCPFLEVAEKEPGLVCDALDGGFHDGIDAALSATTERLACMGHGDLYCQYRLTWRRAGGKNARRR